MRARFRRILLLLLAGAVVTAVGRVVVRRWQVSARQLADGNAALIRLRTENAELQQKYQSLRMNHAPQNHAPDSHVARHRQHRVRASLLGYMVGSHSDSSSERGITARFGKTFWTERIGHSGGPIYRTSDGKAYLLFSWSDAGLETVTITKRLPLDIPPPPSGQVRRIKFRARDIASYGIRIGDSSSRVTERLGRPDIRLRRKPDDSEQLIYVDEWYDNMNSPMTSLLFSVKGGRVIDMAAEE